MRKEKRSAVYWVYLIITIILTIVSGVFLYLGMTDIRTDEQIKADREAEIRSEFGYNVALTCLKKELTYGYVADFENIQQFESIYCVRGSDIYYCKITQTELFSNKVSCYKYTVSNKAVTSITETYFNTITSQIIGTQEVQNVYIGAGVKVSHLFHSEEITVMLNDILGGK